MTTARPTQGDAKPVQKPATARATSGQLPSSPGAGSGAAATLLKIEHQLRKARSIAELGYAITNEVRTATRAQQIFVIGIDKRQRVRVESATATATVDRSSPLILWIEAIVAELNRSGRLAEQAEFDADAFAAAGPDASATYPLRQMLWHPLLDFDGKVMGGMLQARTNPWTEQEITISRHLAEAAAFARVAVAPGDRQWGMRLIPSRRALMGLAAALAVLGIVPVSMSALAPAEVIPRDPFVVTAGVDGVIETVNVEPNAKVAKGDALVKVVDTVLRNRFEVAEREALVAQSRHKRASQLAFIDTKGRQELAMALAELDVKLAERDFAREMLARTVVKAERPGTVLFGDRRDLLGRQVAAGEKLMEIADPATVQLRIDLPVSEAIVLKDGARVKVFLDSDPLHPVDARLVYADHQARVRDGQPLAFRLIASIEGQRAEAVRLGVRGTAQVYSDRVPLAYYLFRKPIAALRQWAGV